MARDLIGVCLFGSIAPGYAERIRVPKCTPHGAEGFEVSQSRDDGELNRILVEGRAQVLVSIGSLSSFSALNSAPLDVRRRWLHYENAPDPEQLGRAVLACFVGDVLKERFPATPLVSVFTPAYRSGSKIHRAFASVRGQTYSNWEWVIYDDSDDSGATMSELRAIADSDARVVVVSGGRNCGVIGAVKRRAAALTRGAILVELDHDDELTPQCLEHIVRAFAAYPDSGFAFSDYALVAESGGPTRFGPWFPEVERYREELLNGRRLTVTEHPGLCPRTVRMLRGTPMHVRAWRRDFYHSIGEWNPLLHISDDHEIFLRSFLKTRPVHIRRLGYIYHLAASREDNTSMTAANLGESVRLYVEIWRAHARQIHERLVELGAEDHMWTEPGGVDWTRPTPAVRTIVNYTFD
jgi:glycosyltransferase involved in cell wall biosynthesis